MARTQPTQPEEPRPDPQAAETHDTPLTAGPTDGGGALPELLAEGDQAEAEFQGGAAQGLLADE